MDRIIAYPSQVPLVENFLQQQKNTSAAVGRLIEAAFGTTTSAAGLAATISSSGVVTIAPGSLMALGVADTLQNGVLGADATPQMKQGIVNTPTTLSLSSGTLATGQSVNILVQASLADAYAGSAVLPYYNTNSPTTPYNGSSGSGSAQPTGIACAISFSSIVGTPATSGTQVTPNAAAGCVPLYVVTWPYGGSPSIAVHPSAPLIDPNATLRGLLPGRLINRQKFTAVGVTQYVPTPGTKVAEVFALGGGGGGAGGQAVTGAMVSPGSGGTAGASGRGRYAVTGPVSVTVGAGGAPQAGGSGFNGGVSSFGALLVAPGGPGGVVLAPTAAGTAIGGVNGAPASGGYLGTDGVPGGISLGLTGTTGYGGAGGASVLGGGGAPIGQNSNGISAVAFGSGGGGTCATTGNGALTGGSGAQGIVIVEEYTG